ncbi:hypothetical protein DPMN_009750 [Dreissena polymorpha]|uniref:Uncharacterized protein n=1 Tax=Dreissena polymorpha TaxID=45954 RepID=A0A9D4MXJ1_DREPO|nr:hypothetical protein DPMN_009750 [Dreissena polymorpha]
MPAFRKPRAEGKKAWLSYDKPYIDGFPVRPDIPQETTAVVRESRDFWRLK